MHVNHIFVSEKAAFKGEMFQQLYLSFGNTHLLVEFSAICCLTVGLTCRQIIVDSTLSPIFCVTLAQT